METHALGLSSRVLGAGFSDESLKDAGGWGLALIQPHCSSPPGPSPGAGVVSCFTCRGDTGWHQ